MTHNTTQQTLASHTHNRIVADIDKLDETHARSILSRLAAQLPADSIADVADSIKRRDYWATVRAMAEELDSEARELLRSGESDDSVAETMSERLHESVDGSALVIYTASNFDVLRYSDNSDAWTDIYGDDLPKDNAFAVLAFCALEADVRETMSDVDDLRTEWQEEVEAVALRLDREALVGLLASVSIDSDDSEDFDTLGEAVAVNVVDGTIDADEWAGVAALAAKEGAER